MNSKKKKLDLFPYLMLLPAMLLLLMITLYPVGTSLTLSFFDFNFLKQGMNFVGIKNYIDILTEGKFLASVGFTFLWTAANVLLTGLLGFVMALLMRARFWGREVLKATMLIPWILPQVVTGFVFRLMMAQEFGILNHALISLGLAPEGFSWLANPKLAVLAVILANSWRSFPFVGLMLYAKMQAIPASHLEAAQIDGASGTQSFLYIVLPYIRTVAFTSLFLVFIWTFNAYDIIKVMTGGGPLEATTSLSLLLQREAFSYTELSRACTMAVCMFVLLLAAVGVLLLLNRLVFRRRKT